MSGNRMPGRARGGSPAGTALALRSAVLVLLVGLGSLFGRLVLFEASANASEGPVACSPKTPFEAPKSRVTGAKQKLVPGSPISLRICRYSSANAHPPLGLVKAVVVSAATTHTIARQVDQLAKPAKPPKNSVPGAGSSCPSDDATALVLHFEYRDGAKLTVLLFVSGCTSATNGDTKRVLTGRAGRKLVSELDDLAA